VPAAAAKTSSSHAFSLQIAKGVLQLTYDGGSRYAYSIATKWRYQNGGFCLIGITANDVDTAGSDAGAVVGIERDANLSTREMVEKIEKILSAKPDGERKTRTTQTRCKVPASFQKKKLGVRRGRDRGAEVHLGLALTRFTAAKRSSLSCSP
jgi:hypothetical protein